MTRALVALSVVALGTPALAADVYEQGAFKLEASGFYKPSLTLYAMQPSLVDATKSLQAAIDDARTLVPPELASELPSSMTLPAAVGLSTHTLRLQARAAWTEKLDLEVAWQLGAVIASHPAFAGTGSSGFLGSTLVTAHGPPGRLHSVSARPRRVQAAAQPRPPGGDLAHRARHRGRRSPGHLVGHGPAVEPHRPDEPFRAHRP